MLPSTASIHPASTVPPGAGNYLVADTIGYRPEHGAPGSTLSYEVAIRLEAG